MSLNENLQKAKRQKNDEFYTQLSTIENELRHYTGHLPGKVVYCNCDDPRVSNFFHYFSYNFERLGLKKLVTACYRNQERDMFSRHDSERAIWLEYKGNAKGGRVPDVGDIGIREFEGDGDFRSAECIELLKQADIVVTNPPFSLFREYVRPTGAIRQAVPDRRESERRHLQGDFPTNQGQQDVAWCDPEGPRYAVRCAGELRAGIGWRPQKRGAPIESSRGLSKDGWVTRPGSPISTTRSATRN